MTDTKIVPDDNKCQAINIALADIIDLKKINKTHNKINRRFTRVLFLEAILRYLINKKYNIDLCKKILSDIISYKNDKLYIHINFITVVEQIEDELILKYIKDIGCRYKNNVVLISNPNPDETLSIAIRMFAIYFS